MTRVILGDVNSKPRRDDAASPPAIAADADDFVTILRRELTRRCHANAHYSLRAFARDLRCDHSSLSQLLRGRRKLTPAIVLKLAPRLRLDAPTAERLAGLAARNSFAEPAALKLARALTCDAWCALAEWPHLAILELTRLPEFRTDSRFIARVLGTTVDEVNIALQRLLRLGLLEMVSPQKWIDRTAATSMDAFARATVRKLLERLKSLADEPAAAPQRRTNPRRRVRR